MKRSEELESVSEPSGQAEHSACRARAIGLRLPFGQVEIPRPKPPPGTTWWSAKGHSATSVRTLAEVRFVPSSRPRRHPMPRARNHVTRSRNSALVWSGWFGVVAAHWSRSNLEAGRAATRGSSREACGLGGHVAEGALPHLRGITYLYLLAATVQRRNGLTMAPLLLWSGALAYGESTSARRSARCLGASQF
jgi:hypothetical protein